MKVSADPFLHTLSDILGGKEFCILELSIRHISTDGFAGTGSPAANF
jgi:hypothetical protein